MGQTESEIRLYGIAASPGVAIGAVLVIGTEMLKVEKKTIPAKAVSAELDKFDTALAKSMSDVEKIYDMAAVTHGEEAAQIFNVHKAMLSDPMLVEETRKIIKNDKTNADYAFSFVMDKYITILQGFQDELFKARAVDVQDLKRRVIRYIRGESQRQLARIGAPVVIFATELTPSDTVQLEKSNILGFATDYGARTSHATILARSIGVPAVVGLNSAAKVMRDGITVILDGDEGLCVINPSKKSLALYKKRYDAYISLEKRLESIKALPARTLDGKDLALASNIEFPEEADHIRELHGDGIGLFRTEYLYLAGPTEPTEEQQLNDYKHIAEQVGGKPVIIRTFDLGGDKPPVSLSLPVEDNPFLGVRGVRLYRDSGHELFRTQIRAIVRASIFGDVRIMFPMIACVSEVHYCKNVVKEIQAELDQEGIPFKENIPIGAMIEVPSAAATADIIAKECDFLSIGTNDLIQYTTAVDRGNKNLDYLYQPYNPAVLRLIHQTIKKGHQQGTWVGMCGEMASDPLMTMVLIGMGLDEFSVSPVSHLLIKQIIRLVDFHACERSAETALDFSSTDQVQTYLKNLCYENFPDLLRS
ncbi:phosphoenolpyruvate--protein phosphotransferase [candidate division KSB1 bacterium]|nr:phosphoenolpyruvate--protein phosphotransferase [candidate division KSB1 bacterium]